MFVNISPAAYNCGETVCSLNFAGRCRNVQLGPAKKGTEADAVRLRDQVERLQEELAAVKGSGGFGSAPSTPLAATSRGALGVTPRSSTGGSAGRTGTFGGTGTLR
jgi:hypothetical protein